MSASFPRRNSGITVVVVIAFALSSAALGCNTRAKRSATTQPSIAADRAAPDADRPRAIRIGTYDSRAVAVAYGRSAAFLERTRQLHEEHARAKAAGDQKAVERLNREGRQLQVRMHLQAFSNAPVDEVFTHLRDRLPELAQRRGLVAIVPSMDYRADARLEVVDVTDDLVSLFDPDAQTQKIIADLKKQSPLPIEQVARMDHTKH